MSASSARAERDVLAVERTAIGIGELGVAFEDAVLYTVGLGSCVAIALTDPVRRIGGLAHALLPGPPSGDDAPAARFVPEAVAELVGRIQSAGAARGRLQARLIGGATMFEGLLPRHGRRLGTRNVEAARRALKAAGVPVVAEDVGGTHGRTVQLDVRRNIVRVTSVLHPDVIL